MENNTVIPVTPLSLYVLSNGFVLNPYEEMDEDLMRELND